MKSKLAVLVVVGLAQVLGAQAVGQTGSSQTQGDRRTKANNGVRFYSFSRNPEEKLALRAVTEFSLPGGTPLGKDSHTFTTPDSHVSTSDSGIHPIDIPPQITLIDEKTLYFNSSVRMRAEGALRSSNGVRFYAFTLKPGEKMTLRMTSETSERMGMEFLIPDKSDKMSKEFMRINYMPNPLKRTQAEVKNITDDPYTLVLAVYGFVNNWYKVDIKRAL